MNMYIDLDGTIVDYRLRMFSLFNHVLGGTPITLDTYWAFKRRRLHNFQIAEELKCVSRMTRNEFEERWLSAIEDHQWLALDSLIDGTEHALQTLSKHFRLYVITARQSPCATRAQIEWLKIDNFFAGVLVTRHTVSKAKLLIDAGAQRNTDIIVGDTGEDIQAGRTAGIRCFSVLSGIRDEDILREYGPDGIFDNLGVVASLFSSTA